jgi:hypothetical protein
LFQVLISPNGVTYSTVPLLDGVGEYKGTVGHHSKARHRPPPSACAAPLRSLLDTVASGLDGSQRSGRDVLRRVVGLADVPVPRVRRQPAQH